MRNYLFTLLAACALTACGSQNKEEAQVVPTLEETSLFTCSDAEVEGAYAWAQKMALSYAHDGSNDAVGPWYEAALPQREAFCMRDVSHQTVGAQVLGLTVHNQNMMPRFAENISESKDWCTYWEINRYNKPAPADYLNDKEFWYNLNANFDVLQACLKLYEWTGDADYLNDPCLTNFYEKSMNEYVAHWQLDPERIMERPPYMHQPKPFDPSNNFHTCRGLPSYVENFRGLTVGVDLIATLQAGMRAYARMAELKGDNEACEKWMEKADAYRELLDTRWWSEADQFYQTFWTTDGKFFRGEGVPFILWFDATNREERIRASVTDILNREWNVENLSAFPALLYRLGYNREALHFLKMLPKADRAAYPEVSYGLIEGIACGLMGLCPSASQGTLGTYPRQASEEQTAELRNVPLWEGSVTVSHKGNHATTLSNHTGRDLEWHAAFPGQYAEIKCDGKTYPAICRQDINGGYVSECAIQLPAGTTLTAETINLK